ncbi:trehalase-like domain-containing protein [Actinomadura sp. K4S16]|uniref:trehalase-like domain-containing protein n=1 Tax=Actinomadura sp. K4S16 TaxID=1316147 RepID=UPI0011EF8024|nr:trehalase-like domain-containing protein [Actinomadura sp. K4S16]
MSATLDPRGPHHPRLREPSAVEDGLRDHDLASAVHRVARVPRLLVACTYDGVLSSPGTDQGQAVATPEAVAVLRELAALPDTSVAVLSGRPLGELAALSRLPAEVHLIAGHGVEHTLGPALITTDAVSAVDALRTRTSAGAVLFIGDGQADAQVFARLNGPDLGIDTVFAPGEPAATAAIALALLERTRRRWLYGEPTVPIERHSLLSDQRTVALLTPDATVTWLCHPRPDSPTLFGHLIGGAAAGRLTTSPYRGGLPLGQRYRTGTMTLETRWPGLTVTDWLESGAPTGPDSSGGHPDARAPLAGTSTLVRVLSGTGTAQLEFAPRPEFGQVEVRLAPRPGGLLVAGSGERAALYSPQVEWTVRSDEDGHDTARAIVDLAACGGAVTLELRLGTHDLHHPPTDVGSRQALAERPWRDWAAGLRLPTFARADVLRSALTLRGLCHAPTGAILAAATSSLPEEIGGVRNWDYRYCWLRDAAMTARTLVDLGSLHEAEDLLHWIGGLVAATGGHPERLHPLYTLDGRHLGPEAVIDTLPGYAGSRPVRVGNLADRQVQLDIFGPVTDLIAAVADARGGIGDEEFGIVEAAVQAVHRRWREPDHGLWEARLPRRHHVYSKVMCWLAVDRALHIAAQHRGQDRPEWRRLRDQIASDVTEHGWHLDANAYTVAYGHPDLDASSLWVGLSGLLAPDDPRFLATVEKVEAELRSGPVVYRYRWDDGLPGREGGFHLCTAWLIEAYLRTGRRDDAEELFTQMLNTAGPTGLLPEQYDPLTERGLGNHPQAYTHLGLIRCALLLNT